MRSSEKKHCMAEGLRSWYDGRADAASPFHSCHATDIDRKDEGPFPPESCRLPYGSKRKDVVDVFPISRDFIIDAKDERL